MTTLPPEANDGQGADQNATPGDAAAQPTPTQPEVPAPGTPDSGATQPPADPIPPQQAPQYAAPPAGAYQQPQAGYQQPQQGYQQPQQAASDPAGTITLNYWLSVFFTWIPALIFYLIEKNKGVTPAYQFHVANLNFSLLRTGVWIVIWLFGAILPFPIDILLVGILWIGALVLFVFHIIAAAKAPEAFRRGGQPEFIFNIPLVK